MDDGAAAAANAPDAAAAAAILRVPQTEQELIDVYTTPGHPIAYSAPSKIYQYYNGKLDLDFIQKTLDSLDVYTLHREFKRPEVYNPYFAYVRRKNFQADLISVNTLGAANDGTNYLNLIIDTFSRKIWVIPQLNKSAAETSDAMLDWLQTIQNDSNPEKQLLTDKGREYVNVQTRAVFNSYNVKHDTTSNVFKASIAERCNKTLQILMYKYMTDKGTDRYIDKLGSLIKAYNNRPHRSLGNHSPNFADKKKNEYYIRGLHIQRYAKRFKKGGRKPKFQVGDRVRIKTYGEGINTTRRAYLQQFKGELFNVTQINTQLPVPMYKIRSMDTEEDITGGFYSNELQIVRQIAFKIENILAERGQGENREVLVKWKYFSPRWNSWIRRADIEQS